VDRDDPYLCFEVDIGPSLDQQVADVGVAIMGRNVQGCEPALKVISKLVQTPFNDLKP